MAERAQQVKTPEHYYNPYRWLAPLYDRMASTVLVPFGGEDNFRRTVIDAMGLKPGDRVLEMGCGTGSNTRLMLETGAEVVAVDLSEQMLARAKRKAPGARFIHGDLTTFETDEPFDWALISLVLHEMSPQVRSKVIATARKAAPKGRLLVLDFAKPRSAVVRAGLSVYLRLVEPELTQDLYQRGVARILEDEGLAVEWDRPLAGGTTRMTCARLSATET